MRKFIQNKLKDQKGLTLIELLAVIVILAIIAAIAIPAIGNIIQNSRLSAVKADATNAISSANIYFTENADQTTVTIGTLKTDGYLKSAGKLIDADSIATGSTSKTLEISTAAITFSGTKAVTFTGATTAEINSDTTKGSDAATGTGAPDWIIGN